MTKIVELAPEDVYLFTANADEIVLRNVFLTEVWVYLCHEAIPAGAWHRCRKMFVGNANGPLTECRTTTIQRGTRYPAADGTWPIVNDSGVGGKHYPWWYISLLSSEARTSGNYPHRGGLVQSLGGVVDGFKAKNLDWPLFKTDVESEQIEVGTIEMQENGLVKVVLAHDCCVAVSKNLPKELTWDECIQCFGPPVRAKPF